MRSLPSVFRALAEAAVVTGTFPERPRPHGRRQPAPDTRLTPGWEDALKHLQIERMESIVRRYRGEPARIENPFAAFPTRSYWLRKMMRDPG